MWTDSARGKYDRAAKRYATDLTDSEFLLIEPWLPPPVRLGRPRKTDLRAVLDAIFYLLRAGCQWRLLPKCFPPRSTVFGYFRRWWRDGTLLGLYYALLVLARASAGREAQPTAGIVDSQSVRTSESGGPRGYDAGKKINGRKRHILVDTLGLLLRGIVHPASVQDRNGLAALLTRIRRRFPFLALIFADGGYQGEVAGHRGPRRAARADRRQALRHGPRLRSPAQALGRRAQLRLVRPQPAPGQGRRDADRQQRRHALPLRHPPAHPKARINLIQNTTFSDGLLGGDSVATAALLQKFSKPHPVVALIRSGPTRSCAARNIFATEPFLQWWCVLLYEDGIAFRAVGEGLFRVRDEFLKLAHPCDVRILVGGSE